MYGYPTTPPKPRLKSKTHRFNALMAALLTAEANMHLLQPLLPVDAFGVISFVLVVGNVILREITKGPVA